MKAKSGKGGNRSSKKKVRRRRPGTSAARLDAALRASDDRLLSVIELSTDYYWETDERHRFTRLVGRESERGTGDQFRGKARWETGGVPVSGTWEQHRKALDAHLPFANFVYAFDDPEQGTRYLNLSGTPVFDSRGVFLGYRGITREVTGEKRAETLSRLENSITRLLAAAEDISVALTSAIREICESQGWEAGSFWKLDEQAGVIRYAGGWCTDSRPVLAQIANQARSFSFAPGEGLPGWVLQAGEPLWVPDIVKDPRITDTSVTELTGWNSAFLFPIGTETGVTGVLDFYSPRIGEPDERLLQAIRVLGREIGHFYRRALALERLRDSEELHATTFDLAEIGIAHVANDGRFLRVNRCLCRLLGYTKPELLSRTVRDISHPEDVTAAHAERDRMRAGQIESFQLEKRYLRKDGSVMWASLTAAARRGSGGEQLYDISIIQDISETKETEARIRYLATHDGLTGLPNRGMFSQLLDHAMESARRHERKFALLFIDLDSFKFVNDTLGHDAGDALLKEVSGRLKSCVRSSDVVARLGGDEFVVLIEEVAEPSSIATIARKILSVGSKPVIIMGRECAVTASIGICVYPVDAQDEQSLMKRADMAMYAAKAAGKNNFRYYSADTEAKAAPAT